MGSRVIGLLTYGKHIESPIDIFQHMRYIESVCDFSSFREIVDNIRITSKKFLSKLVSVFSKLEFYEDETIGNFRSVNFSNVESIVTTNFGDVKYTGDTREVSEFKLRLKYFEQYYDKETDFRHNFGCNQLMKLQRCRMDINKYINIQPGSTFSKPLNMHLGFVQKLQTDKITRYVIDTVRYCVNWILKMVKGTTAYVVVDDIIRSYLSAIDGITFNASYISQPVSQVLTNLHGLSTVGGARGWVKEDIIYYIEDWISHDHCKGDDEGREYMEKFMDKTIESWTLKSKPPSESLSFYDFCTDPMRWATSGGAPKVTIGDEKVRSKWAWALDTLERSDDLYAESLKLPQRARVALKEEKKTRTVITTPMSSYLRQCYILYRLGKPPIKSTVSNSHLVEHLARSNCRYYMSIDASRFDHNIAKDQIIKFFRSIQTRMPDMYDIIQEEIDHIESLIIEWDGNTWNYNNGLLSGWRITSVFGSMYTCGLAEYIHEKTGYNFEYITQGDDIILFSNSKMQVGPVVDACTSYGIETNYDKTCLGLFGEFLKYRYSNDYICGYAGRNVRSLFLANPWLDTSIVTDPQTLSCRWASYFGRLMITCNKAFAYKDEVYRTSIVCKDICSWMSGNIPFSAIKEAMKTPTSLGGLAPVEQVRYEDILKCTSITTITEQQVPGDIKFKNLFVGLKSSRIRVERKTITSKHLVDHAQSYQKLISGAYSNVDYVRRTYKDNTNIFRSILETVLRGRSVPVMSRIAKHLSGHYENLERFYPRYLKKTSNWYERVRSLMETSDIGSPLSMFATLRYDSNTSDVIHNLTRIYMNGLRAVTANSANIMGGFAFTILSKNILTINTL